MFPTKFLRWDAAFRAAAGKVLRVNKKNYAQTFEVVTQEFKRTLPPGFKCPCDSVKHLNSKGMRQRLVGVG